MQINIWIESSNSLLKLLPRHTSHHCTFSISEHRLFNLHLPEGQAGTAWEPLYPKMYAFPPIKYNVSYYFLLFSLLSGLFENLFQTVKYDEAGTGQ
jgi:hypothetical protein